MLVGRCSGNNRSEGFDQTIIYGARLARCYSILIRYETYPHQAQRPNEPRQT